MSTNSSSLVNGSLYTSSDASFPLFMYCFILRPSSFVFTAFIITYMSFLFPLCTLILHRGCQFWQRKRRGSSAAPMSHSDHFTYNVVAMELLGVVGCLVTCCGIFTRDLALLVVGLVPACFIMLGEGFFHVLTCVERYLAVVHPVTYLSLKSARGIRIRTACVTCGWLLSLSGMGLLLSENVFIVVDSCLLLSAITIVSFCSLSVLCVLIRPGPGEQGGDQAKKRAFYTIISILGVLVLRFTVGLTRSVIYMSSESHFCVIMTSSFFFYLPSSLVLPLLFLHRAGTLCSFRH